MLAWLRHKHTVRKAKQEELRRASKAADATLKANPLLVKRATRVLNKNALRWWGSRAVLAMAVTGVTTVYPDLVSEPLDNHAAANGVRDGLQKNFATPNIRVYHRHNPLMPFHLAGQAVRVAWSKRDSALSGVLSAPVFYGVGFIKGALGVIVPSALDAHSISDNRPHAERQCYIRPPGDVDNNVLAKSLTGMTNNRHFNTASAADIKRYYYTFIMTHEARHCDQDKDIQAPAIKEIDADLMADHATVGILDEKDRAALRDDWIAWRLISAVVGDNGGHYTTPAIIRGSVTPMQAIDDAAVVERLMRVLQDAEIKNKNAFPSLMGKTERRYHLALSLLAQPEVVDPQLRVQAEMFVSAVDHFNGQLKNQLIIAPHARIAHRIDMTWLTRVYQPVSPQAKPAKPVVLQTGLPRAGS